MDAALRTSLVEQILASHPQVLRRELKTLGKVILEFARDATCSSFQTTLDRYLSTT